VRSRLAPRIAPCGRPLETKAPDDLIEGPSVSRHPRPLRRTVPSCWRRALFPRGLETRTWAFSSHGTRATRPLTPLSQSLGYILSASSSFPDVACFFVLAPRPRFYGLERIGGCGDRQARRARRLREEPTPVSSWDAFYRQGPFVGSSGRYSPGPAIRSPLATMVEPLSDTLASPWVFVRTSPICIGVRDRLPDILSLAAPDRRFHLRPFTSS